jgi:putative membrane protein
MDPAPQRNDAPELDPRVLFAAERTLLAWVRTGLAMMGFGFVVARFGLFMRELLYERGVTPPPRLGLSTWVGTGLVALGVVVNLAAAAQHWRRMQRLLRGEPLIPKPLSLVTATAAVLALLGLFMAAYLLRAG